ncbi:PKD domain-containing protein [bacterium]|nr:PKD domain-containing protein [bacterium]
MRRLLNLVGFMVIVVAGFAQAPTLPSSNISFSEVFCNRVTVSWTNGNGSGRLVIASEGEPVDTFPTSGYYLARADFGNVSSRLKQGQHVVYNGAGNSVVVTNLKHDTKYFFRIFEYNGSGSTFSYNTANYPRDSVKTEWLNASFSINQPHQCDNDNYFEFYPNVTQSLNQDVSFAWTFGDFNTSSDSSPSHTYSSYGIYNVKLTATTTGCASTIAKKDTVAPIPRIDFELHPDTPNNSYIQCFYNPDGSRNRFFFDNTTVNPYLGTSTDKAVITWDWGDGSTSAEYRGRKTYSQPGTYIVQLTVSTTKTNAENVWCTDSLRDTVVVKPRPLIADSVKFLDTVMCEEGNLFRFENNSGVAGSPTWDFGDNSAQAYTNKTTHSYLELAKTVKYKVTLTFIDNEGCYDEYSDSVRVLKQPNNYFEGLDSPYCQFDPIVTLTPNLSGGYFFGTNKVTSNGKFTPDQVGLYSISYRIDQDKCVDTFTLRTEVLPRPYLNLGEDTSICEGTSFELSVEKGDATALWSTNATDSFISISDEGLYWLELDNGICPFRDSINIEVISPPSITLGVDSVMCGDQFRTVNVTSDEATYIWSDGYPDPIRTIDKTGFYEVLVYNKCGRDSATVDLTILPYPCDIYVPSAFSPDGNGLNDVFRAVGNVEITGLQIYNRWGELLYETDSPTPSWDGYYQGARVQQGTYFYMITYMLPAGEYALPQTISGPLTVVY